MRKLWKYIGILLMINCAIGPFAFEFANTLSVLSKPMMEFSFELTSKLHAIELYNTIEGDDEHLYKDLEKQIDKLEEKFGSETCYDNFKRIDSISFEKISGYNRCKPIFVFKNKKKIIKNYANDVLLYEDEIKDEPVLSKPRTFLPLIYNKSYEKLEESVLQYQDLCSNLAKDPQKKEESEKAFGAIFNKFFEEKPYFQDIFKNFDEKISNGDLNGAFIQLTLKFALLQPLLGGLGMPDNFRMTPNIKKRLDYHCANRRKKEASESKEYDFEDFCQNFGKMSVDDVEDFSEIFGSVSFQFIDIAHRSGLFILFREKIKNFMVHQDFSIWIKNNKNVINFVCFYCGFFEKLFDILSFIGLSKHFQSITKNAYNNEITKLFKYKETFSIVREDLSYGASTRQGIENFHSLDNFNSIMECFLSIFYFAFCGYFLDNMVNPSSSQESIASIQTIEKPKTIKVTKTPLTNMEKNLLKFSNSLNTTLKEFFQKKQPSKANFNHTLFTVEKIKNQFFGSIMDLRIKYMNPHISNKYFDDLALTIFLSLINPENTELYNKFIQYDYNARPINQEEEKAPVKPKTAKDLMEKKSNPSEISMGQEEKKVPVPSVQDFSQKNLKKMSEATSKQYKKQNKKHPQTTMKSLESSEPKEEIPVLNQSQKQILEASKTFYDIYENKFNLYEGYKAALNDANNKIKNCINLMEITVNEGTNLLSVLIKKLQSLGLETEALENIQDKVNDRIYEEIAAWVALDDSYNLDQINKLIKKEKHKIEQFHRIIELLSEANMYLDTFITNWVQENGDENENVVVFATKTQSLFSRPMESQPFYQSGHIPKVKGDPRKELEIAKTKKMKDKQVVVPMDFKDAIDQQKEMEEAIKQMEKKQEEATKEEAKKLKEEKEIQAKKNKEQIQQIIKQLESQHLLKKK